MLHMVLFARSAEHVDASDVEKKCIFSFTETVVLPLFVNFFEILHVFWFEKLIRGV